MAFEIILSGRVQGVGCRFYCVQAGKRAGIHGAVTNLRDGTVQVILDSDSSEEVRQFADALQDNWYDLSFYGHIRSVVVRPSSLPVSGECVW